MLRSYRKNRKIQGAVALIELAMLFWQGVVYSIKMDAGTFTWADVYVACLFIVTAPYVFFVYVRIDWAVKAAEAELTEDFDFFKEVYSFTRPLTKKGPQK